MAIKNLNSIIVGYGYAGRNLHHPCIRKAAADNAISGKIGVVERCPKFEHQCHGPVFRTFEEVRDFHPLNTVVHIATPPEEHGPALYDAVASGYRMFIIEKPVGITRTDAGRLVKTATAHDLKIIPNLPWPGTPLTAQLVAIVESGTHGKLSRFEMVQHKSRPPRDRELAEGGSAFDIEMPHQIALALQVVRAGGTVIGASCKPYLSLNGPVPLMGGASMLLRQGDTVTDLQSDLDAPLKERRVDLHLEDGWRVRAWYPVDGTDGSQRIVVYDEKGQVRSQQKLWSDPMPALFVQAYRYFLGAGPAPLARLSLAVESVHLTCDAKSLCGIDDEFTVNRGAVTAKEQREGDSSTDVREEAA
jgi:predicted dehydrogenase